MTLENKNCEKFLWLAVGERCTQFGVGGGGRAGRWRVPSGNCSVVDHRHPTWIGSVTAARSESDK